MDRLTKEEIAEMCEAAIGLDCNRAQINRRWTRQRAECLRDLALQSLESVRSEALAEWAESVRVTIRGIDLQAERITRHEQTTFRDGENQVPDEDEDFENVVVGYRLNTGLWHHLLGLLASFPTALQSTARVAEEIDVHSTELRK